MRLNKQQAFDRATKTIGDQGMLLPDVEKMKAPNPDLTNEEFPWLFDPIGALLPRDRIPDTSLKVRELMRLGEVPRLRHLNVDFLQAMQDAHDDWAIVDLIEVGGSYTPAQDEDRMRGFMIQMVLVANYNNLDPAVARAYLAPQ